MAVQTISNPPLVPVPIQTKTNLMIDRLEGLIHKKLSHQSQKRASSTHLNLKQELQYELNISAFRTPTNFDGQDFLQSSQLINNNKSVISTLGALVFGFSFFGESETEKLERTILSDQRSWKNEISNSYPKSLYKENVSEAFRSGSEILKERIAYEKNLKYQRIALYAMALFASIAIVTGKLSNMSILDYIGYFSLISGAVWYGYMIYNQFTNDLRQFDLESDLKRTLLKLKNPIQNNVKTAKND